jgi:hypothetical protein
LAARCGHRCRAAPRTSSAETRISAAFSSASCLMKRTIWSICFSTCERGRAGRIDGGEAQRAFVQAPLTRRGWLSS